MKQIALLAVGVGLLVGADGPSKDADEDRGRLQGSWTMASVVVNGEDVPEESVKTGRLVIEGDHYRVTLGAQTVSATIRLDTTRSPRQIDFTFTDGPQEGQAVRGIYEIDGDLWG